MYSEEWGVPRINMDWSSPLARLYLEEWRVARFNMDSRSPLTWMYLEEWGAARFIKDWSSRLVGMYWKEWSGLFSLDVVNLLPSNVQAQDVRGLDMEWPIATLSNTNRLKRMKNQFWNVRFSRKE
jgi:hypothetical protein